MSRFNLRARMQCLTGMITGLLALSSFVNALQGQEFDQVSVHIGAETTALVRIDSAALAALIDTKKQDRKDSEQTVLQLRLKQTREVLGTDPIWLAVGFPKTPLSVQILVRDPERIEKLKDLWDIPKRYPYGPEPQVVVRQLEDSDRRESKGGARLDQWKKLMASGEDAQARRGKIQFGCLPPAILYDTYRELLTDLPDYLGGAPVTVLTDGLQSVSGTIDLKTGALEGAVSSASPAAAVALADQVTELLKSLPPVTKSENTFFGLVRMLRERLESSTFKPVVNQVQWQIASSDEWRPEKLLEFAVGSQASRSATRRLRNLALGVLNYESARQHLPPPRGTKESTGLSWRVYVLPFLGEFNLYQKFALDEPWDSPTNIKLLPLMPDVFSDYGSKLLAPASSKPGYTTVVAPISDNTIMGSPKTVTFGSITDGSSNTILLVIVKNSLAVPWTAPQDYVFDRENPASGLQVADGKVPVVWCDGSTKLLSQANDAETWCRAFEMNDGEVVRAR